MTIGIKGFIQCREIDIILSTLTIEECMQYKKADHVGFPVSNADKMIVTVFSQAPKSNEKTARIDVSSACVQGKYISIFLTYTPTPSLFVYSDEQHYGMFSLPESLF